MSVMCYERRGPIALLTFDRPETMNPLGREGDGNAIRAICDEINADLDIRCAILTGAGKAFCAGGDVKAIADSEGPFSGPALRIRSHYQRNVHRLGLALRGLQVPLIAAVNGAAIGLGCDVACMADIRIASDRARFGVTFLALGLVPGDGGAWLLPRIIGSGRAAELLFTARVIDAATAQQWGLVNDVVAHDALIGTAVDLAEKIARLPPHALRLAKSLLRQGESGSYDQALEAAALAQVLSHATPAHREAMAAAIERGARGPD